ncbi:uncharacterized protein EDB91DRAFT_1254842 [Suillus paluster]|uniref:uncharacterized protein n=1 Tax=Suillus paluster TaxID=48578 RepID=UPI001B87D07C|nr:uncharacterized protein EDB91DRAFT_1254842 [Suillus paluster]KAG1725369.1 hypothetical protein EDB91DRAFT_1254842 [Suillus paluster]
MPTRTAGNQSPHASTLTSAGADDAGALELGVQSTWTHDDNEVSGVDRSESINDKPPTSQQSDLSVAWPWLPSTPLTSNEGNKQNLPLKAVDDENLTIMSLSPLLNSLGERDLSPIRYHVVSPDENVYHSALFVPEPEYSEQFPKLMSVFDWSDMPDNGDIGDVPEFPILDPIKKSPTAGSSPRIPTEAKGKLVDPLERNGLDPQNAHHDWLDQWTEFDEGMADLGRPGTDDPDKSLRYIWNDDNRCLSIQMQNIYLRRYCDQVKTRLTEQTELMNELQDRVQEL